MMGYQCLSHVALWSVLSAILATVVSADVVDILCTVYDGGVRLFAVWSFSIYCNKCFYKKGEEHVMWMIPCVCLVP